MEHKKKGFKNYLLCTNNFAMTDKIVILYVYSLIYIFLRLLCLSLYISDVSPLQKDPCLCHDNQI